MPNTPFMLLAGLVTALAAAIPLPTTPKPDIADLRAQGPAALAKLLARWDAMSPGADRDALADTIDHVAAQRYATVSRMYWYTDLASATAAAQQRHVPILELRLLGRLDDELSCANSRIFRETLYANTALSAFLRDHFVLYWSTERPVPQVTIDFGDGRSIRTTATGNSAHVIRDERGEIVDLLPGVYAPGPFRAELDRTLALIATLDPASADRRRTQIREYHRARGAELRDTWNRFAGPGWSRPLALVMKHPPDPSAVARAQMLTVSKAYIEVPQLTVLGAEPGSLAADETAAWAQIAHAHWGEHDVLDRASTTLVLALHNAGPVKSSTTELAALIPRFEQHLLADSALDEFKLRTKVHDYFASQSVTFAALDAWLYTEVFGTPAADRWLGLLPRTDVTGLPGDGATVP